MAPSYFPLRWESTGDQWWYASPIDWAAANGLYDLVTELLHLDTNLLIKLTSLRRIRRLETVWDDEAHFQDVAKCRSYVARKLLLECETGRSRTGHNLNNSLISAGYGGWLLYTAASAGDVDFVKELLGRDPLLVFGEGEYGVTDMLYAAVRGKNSEVFNILLDSALLRKDCIGKIGTELDEGGGVFRREMVNRAIHAAARGGNWEILKQLLGSVSQILSYRDAQGCTVLHAAAGRGQVELLGSVSQILSYRDAQGCTVLHAAAARGQVEVVRNLIVLPDIINSTDAQGNTALHVASYRGYLPVVEILIQAFPSLTMLTNHNGDTFLHMAVYGFRSPGFCRLDKHTELMKQLSSEKIVNIKDIINARNNNGRTALHVAVIHDVKCDVVESLMSVPSIDLNIHDADGMTPLDHLKQRPRSATSEVLIKQLISAGGISNCQDYVTRNALVTHLKTHGIGGSPGTSFRISDAEIFLYTGIENSFDANNDLASVRARLGATIRLPSYDLEVTGSSPGNNISACASKAADIYSPQTSPGGSLVHSAAADNDVESVESNSRSIEVNNYESANSSYNSKSSPANYAAKRLKNLLHWPKRRETKAANSELEDDNSVDSFCSRKNLEDFPTPLRQRYSKQCSLPNNKRTVSIRTFLPSPSAKKYFTAGLMQGVIKVKPHVLLPFQGVSNSSHSSNNKQKHVDTTGPSCSNRPIDDGGTLQLNYKQSSFNKKLMNRYFSFGAQG